MEQVALGGFYVLGNIPRRHKFRYEKEPVFFFAESENNPTPMSNLLGLQMKTEEFNPVYRSTQQTLIQTRGRLASLEAQRDDLGQRLAETKKMLAEAEMQLATKEARLEELTTTYTIAKDAYLVFAKRFAEASLWVASRVNELKIVDPAVAPRDPVNPRVRLNVALGGALALMAFTFLAFFLEYVEKAEVRGGSEERGVTNQNAGGRSKVLRDREERT